MAGFEKYEKLLNKKRKKEAYLNLLTTKNGNELPEITNGSNVNNEEPSEPDNLQGIKEVYWDIKKKVKNLHQIRGTPKLKLLPIGEESLLDKNYPFALKNDQIQYFIEQALTGTASKHLTWCTLKQHNFLSKIVVVIVEHFGINELTSISNWTPSKNCPAHPTGESAPLTTKSVSDDGSIPPPSKKLKRGDCEDGSDMQNVISGSDTRAQSAMLLTALPRSAPLFSLHLNMHAATQGSCYPLEKILCKKVTWDNISAELQLMKENEVKNKNQLINTPEVQQKKNELLKYDSKENAVLLDKLMTSDFVTSCSKNIMLCENNFPKLSATGLKNQKISRCSLLLSLQEMIDHKFPLPIPGFPAFEDKEFAYLHRVVTKVSYNSPLFGIDCEMCDTERGLELTWVSVVNEKFEPVYTNYVKPPYPILKYLTKYSGVTKKKLSGVKTTLKDVQESLRQVIPPDGILVGHSLDSDLRALKLFHPYVIDTSIIFNFTGKRKIRSGLKLLSAQFLKNDIQSSLLCGHNPTEDAAASLRLALLKLEQGIMFGDVVKNKAFHSELSELGHLQKKIQRQSIPRNLMLPINKDYFLNMFVYAERSNKSSVLITTDNGIRRLQSYLRTKEENLVTHTVSKSRDVLKMPVKDNIQADFLVCHCLMPEFPKSCSKEKAQSKLASLDKGLAALRASLPPNALIMTVFTGSPLSVPLDDRSNAAVMVDLVGQDKSSFFR